ncbi:MAG: 2Fe-2S iron-sulfur cluster-binding protein [Clostridia bacterium]|nr:2Fe-2S iron-sulfur cluster-binding protein [Clostridia bacterium]
MKVTIVTANGETVLNAATGSNLLSLLQSNAFFVDADCGGRGTCGKCKVKLLEGNTSAPLDEGGFFNCCKHTVDGDITIDLNDNTAGAFSAATAIAPHRIKARQGYGLAVDIGTTSIAVYLVDLSNGKPLDSAAQLNRQISFGADVISRINASSGDGLTLMQQSVRTQISAMSEELLRKHNIKEFEKTIIAGNNTMLHLYLGKDPSGMGQAQAVIFSSLNENQIYEEARKLILEMLRKEIPKLPPS